MLSLKSLRSIITVVTRKFFVSVAHTIFTFSPGSIQISAT